MRKAWKRSLALLLVLVMFLSLSPAAAFAAEDGAGEIALAGEAASEGVIAPAAANADGEADGDGDVPAVSRVQWVAALVSTFGMTITADNYPDNYYSDISAEDSFYRDVMVAVEFGVIDLEAGEPFRPNEAATRDFAASTLVFCLGFQPEEEQSYTYSDTVPHPFAAQLAVNRGWFALVAGQFLPDLAITEDEKAFMLSDAAAVLAGDVIDPEHENTGDFASGAVVFPMGTQVEAPEEGQLLIYDTSLSLSNGSLFVVYYGDLPLAFKALSVTREDDHYTVSCTTDGAEDVIQDLDYEGVINPGMEDFQPAGASSFVAENGVRVKESATTFKVGGATNSLNGTSRMNDLTASKTIELSNGLTATISATLTNITLDTKVSVPKCDYHVIVNGDTHISTSVRGSLADAIGTREVELGRIPFLYGLGSLRLYFEYDLTGQIVLSWDGNLSAGFSYNKSTGFRVVKNYYRKAFTINAEVTITAGLKASAEVSIEVVKASIWASVGAKGVLKAAFYDSGTPGRCADFTAWMYAKVGASASITLVGKWSQTENIFTASNSPVRIHYHFEDGQLVGECTRGKDFTDKTGSAPGTFYTDPDSDYFNPWGSSGNGSYYEVIIWEYDLDENNLATITKFRGGTAALLVPATIDGYTVKAIGNGAFQNNTRLRTVTISDGITSIGNNAFQGCSNLYLIDIPDSVTSIGDQAFAYTGLTSLTLPGQVEYLGYGILWANTGVKELTIPKTLSATGKTARWIDAEPFGHQYAGVSVLSVSHVERLVFESGTTEILDCFAQRSYYLKEVVLPDTLTKIGNNAFDVTASLETINFPDSLTYIGNYAFAETGLTQMTLPKYVEHLGHGILWAARGVKEITIPKTILTVSEESRWIDQEPYGHVYGAVGVLAASYVEKLVFEPGSTYIPHQIAQHAAYLNEVIIPNSVTQIENSAFGSCVALETLTIPDSVTTIGNSAFSSTGLTELTIPNSVTTIGNYTFAYTPLTQLTLPKYLESLGVGVLWGNTGVKELTIPKSLKTAKTEGRWIDMEPFGHVWTDVGPLALSGVETLSFEAGTKTILGKIAERDANLKKVTIPDSVNTIGDSAFVCCYPLESVSIPDSVTTINNYAFSAAGLKAVVVPDSVTSMGEGIFQNCTSLASVKLPASRTEIPKNTFSGCTSLPKIELPEPVEYIRENAFQDCTALSEIVWSKAPKQIDSNAFRNCDSLKTVEIPATVITIWNNVFYDCDALASIVIPDSVTSIGSAVFYNCDALTGIEIPDSVTSIGNQLCYDCDVLKDVKLGKGTTAIPTSAFEHCDALESVVIPYRVTAIGAKAFKDCQVFTSISIPRAVTTIAEDSFSYYDKLTIYGVPGTYAETYANEKDINFVSNEVNAAKVTLSETTLTLYKGQSAKLTFTVEPENFTDAVSWKSSDTSIATIADDGTVKAVAVGTATIKLIVGDVSASCKVTVVQPVTGISINRSSLTMQALDTFQLTATVNPANAYNKEIVWSSSDESVAAVDETGLVTALKKGTAKITVAAQDGSGKTATCTVTVSNSATICRTVEELESPHKYPNSCKDFWVFTVRGAEELAVSFDDRTEIEDGFDYLYVFDGTGAQIGKYTGSELAGQTVTVPGDTVRLQLVSDDSGNEWGFKVSGIRPSGMDTLKLPAALTAIESEAFAGLQGVYVEIPAGVTSIAEDAFKDGDATILAKAGSYAIRWAEEHGVPCLITEG